MKDPANTAVKRFSLLKLLHGWRQSGTSLYRAAGDSPLLHQSSGVSFRFAQQSATFILLLSAIFFVAINYKIPLLTGSSLLFLCLAGTAMVFSWLNIRNFALASVANATGFCGQAISIPVRFIRKNDLGCQQVALTLIGDSGNVLTVQYFMLDGYEQETSVTLSVNARSRGVFRVCQLRIDCLYPIGLAKTSVTFDIDFHFTVYPKPELSAQATPNHLGKRAGGQDQGDMILREYQHGDAISRIHWRSVAGEKGIHIKQFEDTADSESWVDWFDFHELPLEQRLSHLTQLIVNAEQRGQRYGLRMPNREVPPATGARHRHSCLTMLAKFNNDKP